MLPTVDEQINAQGLTLHISYDESNHQTQLERTIPGDMQSSTTTADNNLSPMMTAAENANHTPYHPRFLDWTTFEEATLPPRTNARRSRLDRILSPLKSVRAGFPGSVGVDGLGGVIESAHGLFHAVRRLDFMESERSIYLLRDPTSMPSCSLQSLPRRELERYENELFDMSKYTGSCEYLTAMTWSEESLSGSITLYRVLFGKGGETVGIRPVVAMSDVPSPVLVKMRTEERARRKTVLRQCDEDGGFEWKATVGGRPRYVRLGEVGRAVSRFASSSRGRAGHSGPDVVDADGVSATIPQFLALLHASRSILEDATSSRVGVLDLNDNNDVTPAVFITRLPRSNPHEGDGVHVAVLTPNDALWVEEDFVWSDLTGLAELRQRQYWQLIERERARSSVRARSRNEEDE